MKQLLAGVNQGGREDDPDQRALAELETWLDALIDERVSRFQS
jgi:hypothetical protein